MPFLRFLSSNNRYFHRFAFEKIGRLLLRLNFPPKLNGHNDPGYIVVLISDLLNPAHAGVSCCRIERRWPVSCVCALEKIKNDWHDRDYVLK